MTNLIGISGKIGSGKDTVGKVIQTLTQWNKQNDLSWNENTIINCVNILNNYSKPEYCFSLPLDWKIKKFATKLKQIVSMFTGIPVEDLEKQEVKDRVLGEEWVRYRIITKGFPNKYVYNREIASNECANAPTIKRYVEEPMTVRQFLQEIGTEAMRNVIHPNIWVNALFVDYKKDQILFSEDSKPKLPYHLNTPQFPNWIITDTRFPNELQAVKDKQGITIRVNRPHGYYNKYTGGYKEMPISYHPSEIALDDAVFDYTIDNNGTIEELIEKVKEILIKEKIICINNL